MTRWVRTHTHVTTTHRPKKQTWTIVRYTVALIAVGLCLWGRHIATAPPEIRRIRVPIADLPPSFDGYTILQLTDIHLKNARDVPRLEALVARTNALKPDLIAITGDVVDGPMDNLRARLRPLGKLRAKDGVWVVLGNHEYYADAEACVVEFERLGFTVLLDEHRVLPHNDGALTLAGVTNPQNGMHGSKWSNPRGRLAHATADASVALRNAPPQSFKILLAHQPKSLVRLGELGVALAMAGHVHGGGFFPWSALLPRFTPYRSGLWREGKTWQYVSRGLGTFGPKLRLGARPELAVFRLERSLTH
jgi:predicted MPP superfamily phosphohydrolase